MSNHVLEPLLQDVKNKRQADRDGIDRNHERIIAIRNENLFLINRAQQYGKSIKALEAIIEGKDRVCI